MPGLSKAKLNQARSYRAGLREAQRRAQAYESWEERAAIIEEGAKVDRATAERWATECIRRVKGAV